MVSKWKFLYICYVVYYIVLLVYYIFLLMHPLINKRQSQTITKSLAKLIMIGTNCSRKATNLSLHRQCFRHEGVWLWHQNRACADMYVREQSMPKVIIWDLKYIPRILHATLQWRYGHGGVSNHQPHDGLLNRLFNCRSKKTSKPHITGICAGNSPVAG